MGASCASAAALAAASLMAEAAAAAARVCRSSMIRIPLTLFRSFSCTQTAAHSSCVKLTYTLHDCSAADRPA